MRRLQEFPAAVRSIAYSPDGRLLAAGYDRSQGDGWLVMWALPAGERFHSFKWKNESVEAVEFAPDGARLAVGRSGGNIYLWDAALKRGARAAHVHKGGVKCLAFSRDGTWLASGGWDRSVVLSTVPKLQRCAIIPEETVGITGVVFCADGKTVTAAGASGSLFWLDLESLLQGRAMKTAGRLFALAASSDGRLLAAGGGEGTITLWRTETDHPGLSLHGHAWTVYGLAFTPDGRTLISGSADGTVRLWDVESGREVQCFRWHQSWVTCVAAAPDGMTAAAGSNDGSVVVWDLL